MQDLEVFFTTINTFFDHIYIITLQRATDRHAHIRKELNGLQYELFFGKDKQAFSLETLKANAVYDEAAAKKNHRYGKAMQAGQVGCSWSHAEVYKDVIEKGYQKVLILEDDVVVDKNAAAIFDAVLKQLPADWALLYFGFAEREKPPATAELKKLFYHLLRSLGLLKFSHTTIQHLYPKKIATYVYLAGYHDCSHAYAITLAAAKKLLQLQQPISFIADNLLAHAVTNQIVKGYIILPKIINQQYQLGTASASYLND